MAIFFRQDIPGGRPSEKPTVRSATEKVDFTGAREDLSEEVLSTISNTDFLNIQKSERLQHITYPTKKSDEHRKGDDVTFRFTFNGKLNSDLYLKTTAGQVFPPSVKEVIANGVVWKRNGQEGEFFTQTGQRLIIKDGTSITIDKIATSKELQEEEARVVSSVSEYKEQEGYDIILAGAKRNISPKLCGLLFTSQIEGTPKEKRSIRIEEVITEYERVKDYFSDDFGANAIIENSEPSKKFLAYYLNLGYLKDDVKRKAMEELLIGEIDVKTYNRKRRHEAFRGFRGMEELTEEERKALTEIPTETLEKWKNESFGLRFTPGSKEAMQLFTLAAISMKPSLSLDEAKKWGTSQSLHEILLKESNGVVGVANYTLKNKKIDGKEMKARAMERSDLKGEQLANKEFNVTSTAIGLGQLTMSNEYLLPNGRNSIGIPLEEAIGMLQYIRERYGHPDIARKVYGTTGHYSHPTKGVLYKGFEEGY